MKTFEAKTLEDAKRVACEELGITSEELKYNIIDEKRGLFSKKVVIECYCEKMVEDYIKDYVTTILNDMGFEVEIVTFKQDDRIY